MSIWKTQFSLHEANKIGSESASGNLGIEITEFGDDFLKGKMPVDDRTRQSNGMLHGGSSLLFAETLGSLAAQFAVESDDYYCLGQIINGDHIKSTGSGWVYGTAKPYQIEEKSQVWGIEIKDEDDQMICIVRLTLAVIKKEKLTQSF